MEYHEGDGSRDGEEEGNRQVRNEVFMGRSTRHAEREGS
jgi:hypothetical protein